MKRVTIQGLAHITGGGFVDNVPRILPDGVCAVFDLSTWKVPRLFRFIEEEGRVDREEMYRVFNMGSHGRVRSAADAATAMKTLARAGENPGSSAGGKRQDAGKADELTQELRQ